MKKISLFISLIWAIACQAQEIKVNQVGFYPADKKVAAVPSATGKFTVVDANNKTVFKGQLSEAKNWEYSEENVSLADFSEITKSGTYTVKSGDNSSFPFEIKKDIYTELLKGGMKAYYFNRASTSLLEENAGIYKRAEGHPDNNVLVHASAASTERPEGASISSPKGWYDAGDYNKYIVNSGISTYTLLLSYAMYPEVYKGLTWNIPESGNQLPDILDEAKWNIDWMLTMQDPNDGGLYHKLTTKNFEGYVLPKDAINQRYVVQKTTTAALNHAAVMAVAYRVYKPFDAAYADKCLSSGIKAWEWANKNPHVYYQQPADIKTGQYEDNNDSDEFFWAATELTLATGKAEYLSSVKNWENTENTIPNWQNVAGLGWISLSVYSEKLPSEFNKEIIKTKVTGLCKELINSYENSAYDVVMGVNKNDFIWGSNSTTANQSMVLLSAYSVYKNAEYLEAAKANLDYLLGRNPTGYCYVTGFGSKPTMNPHHRTSESDGIENPVPGFLAGGPQPEQQDKCANYKSKLPALSYLDEMCSYSTNEVTINWNAPLVFDIAAIKYYASSMEGKRK